METERLLRAAADFLSTRPNATLDEIGAAAGVSPSTLYRHFDGRTALLEALDHAAIEQMRGALKTSHSQRCTATSTDVPHCLRRWITRPSSRCVVR
ncbi:TetR/AcrR family transcriptional regulator [Mycobacterium marinum]|uniref:TetR/AcrR family transcriptional regulator n=1 Tax=Mycobacterium marinum TaxID=1781 RepID=UPI001FB75E7F|nr:helix-turn-helix domain-containing protein [Mycobacterium marinum]